MTEIQIEQTPWQIFDKPHFVDNSTTQYEYVEYKERNVNVTGISEYNLINQDLDVPLMVPDSFIQVKCVIKRADTGADINTGQIALNNNGFNIFQRAQYLMNDQLIEDLEEVGVATLVKGLIDYSKSYGESMCNEFWELDIGSAGNNVNGNLTVIRTLENVTCTINGTSAEGYFRITKPDGGTAFADDQAVTLYFNGEPLTVVAYHGTAAQTSTVEAFQVVRVDDTNAQLKVTNRARYDTYRLFKPDGTEVQIFVDGVQAVINSITDAVLKLILNTAPALALAADRTITSKIGAVGVNNFSYNIGFDKRRVRSLNNSDGVTANKTINLFLPIRKMFKLFEYNQHVFRGIKHTIKLYKNTNYKTLFLRTDAAQNAVLNITDMSWWVPTLRPSIEYGLKLDKDLNSGMKTTLLWNQLKCISSSDYDSTFGVSGTVTWRITSAGNKPIKVYIVFRHLNQYNNGGSQNSNNAMVFQHMNITNINLRINSLQFPKEEFTADFITSDDWGRLYMQYLQVSGKSFDMEGGGASVCYDEFATLYPIFCFDLTKQDPQIWANVTTAEMELKFKREDELDAPNNVNFRIYAIIEFERKIEISGTNNRMQIIL